jgi:hypothetical protein
MEFEQEASIVAGKLEVVLGAQEESLLRGGARFCGFVTFGENEIAGVWDV